MKRVVIAALSDKAAEELRNIKGMKGTPLPDRFMANRLFDFKTICEEPFTLEITLKNGAIARLLKLSDFKERVRLELKEKGLKEDRDYMLSGE